MLETRYERRYLRVHRRGRVKAPEEARNIENVEIRVAKGKTGRLLPF